jgi:dTDP-4-dehydrorhamnose 3,5-epimerase
MKLIKTDFEGVFVLEPVVYHDDRGFFTEIFNQRKFQELTGLEIDFIQDNLAQSKKGVIRGLHYQKEPFSQAKLVTVIKGKVQDVIVDMRPDSDTFGKYFSIILSEKNKKQLFIPRGFAHGYLSLEENSIFYYKIDNIYNKEAEGGLFYADKELGIPWQFDNINPILSPKDKLLPSFKEWLDAQ